MAGDSTVGDESRKAKEKELMNDDLRDQYEHYPYPPRDPADEAKRLITGSPSHIVEIEHHILGGRRDRSKPFRVLVAGGGTGDATVMLASQHAAAGIDTEIVHLDISAASSAIARARIDARKLTNTRFVQGAIEDLPTLNLGEFDYIDCCGVLHHLEDPVAGLRVIRSVLKPDGGLGMMVYAPLGRTGVYHAQAMLQMIAGTAPDPERIAAARDLLGELPASNWLKRNPYVGDHVDLGDSGIYDLLLHRRDRAYSVPELAELIQQGGMRPVNFIEPTRYDPNFYFSDPKMIERVRGLNRMQRAAFAELLAGNMKTHILYAIRDDNRASTLAMPETPETVPVLRDDDGPSLAALIKPGMSLKIDMDGVKLSLPLPDLAAPILAQIDGNRSLASIHSALESGLDAAPDWETFKTQFDQLYSSFYGLSRMFLRKPA
jgi:SAM-dependent methyltransferase